MPGCNSNMRTKQTSKGGKVVPKWGGVALFPPYCSHGKLVCRKRSEGEEEERTTGMPPHPPRESRFRLALCSTLCAHGQGELELGLSAWRLMSAVSVKRQGGRLAAGSRAWVARVSCDRGIRGQLASCWRPETLMRVSQEPGYLCSPKVPSPRLPCRLNKHVLTHSPRLIETHHFVLISCD